VHASPRIVGKVVGAISAQTDSVLPQYQEHFAPRFADPARAKAAGQVYRTFVLYEYPKWVRGLYADRRLTMPTLWLHGLSDPFFKPITFNDIVEHADDVRIEYLEGCGHFPAEECPQLVAEHLRGFFG
jgi:pimeloyl-ACP methyl ester carboxylesterase